MADDFDDDDFDAHTSDGAARPNDYDSTAAEVKSFIERLTHLDDEIADLRSDKQEVYLELKGRGFDKKAIDATMKVLKLRADKAKADAKLEVRAIASIYLTALGEDDFEELL